MRQVDRGLKKSQREIEREIHKLQVEEKKTLAEIKKLAGQGQTVRPARRPARPLTRCAVGLVHGLVADRRAVWAQTVD